MKEKSITITFKQLFKRWLLKHTCSHDWEVHYEIKVRDSDSILNIPVAIRQTLICNKCGKIKKINL